MDIFCDSSFSEQEKRAGIGILIKKGERQENISTSIPCDNNNIGELYAIYLSAILAGGEKCVIHSDSQVALDFINNSVKSKTRKDFDTQQKWINYNQMRVLAYKTRRLCDNITFTKIKAHRKDNKKDFIANNIADLLAKNGIAR